MQVHEKSAGGRTGATTVTVPAEVRQWVATTAADLSARRATGRSALALAGAGTLREVAAVLGPYVPPPDPDVGYLVVHSLLDPSRLGPTPASWTEPDGEESLALDVQLVLAASTLGTPFGWTGQQDGRIVNNVVPSRGKEMRQVGASSTVELVWHTEDAFHPGRADVVMLACMRNPDRIGTRVANVRHCELSAEDLERLSQPWWQIEPDESYGTVSLDADIAGTAAVVRGPDGLRLRYDPSYSRPLTADPDVERAFDRLGSELSRCAVAVDLEPGDLLMIDNNVVAHSRAPFQAHYDGTDRWLKRVQVRTGRRPPEPDPAFDSRAFPRLDAPLAIADV